MLATYVEALRQSLLWARALQENDTFGTLEQAILRLGFAEYLQQMASHRSDAHFCFQPVQLAT